MGINFTSKIFHVALDERKWKIFIFLQTIWIYKKERERKWLEEKREIKNKKEREKGGKEKARDRMSQQKMYIKKTTNNWKEWKKETKKDRNRNIYT